MTTDTSNAKLFAKMAKVMATVRTLEKTGENKFDRYSYVTADAIAIRIGKIMSDVGLAFFPSMVGVDTSEYETQKGGKNFRTVAHFQMTFACTETGATFTTLWSGEAIDRSDKSISKAAVSATKYCLLKTFLLAGGDEEDADAQSPTVDNPFEQPQVRATASTLQVAEFNTLGHELYGEQWDAVCRRNVERISEGRTPVPAELSTEQIGKLIAGMQNLKSKRKNEKVAA